MEQELINELIKLLCKSGGETFVGNFQKDGCKTDPKEHWNKHEISEAIQYVKYINELFGKQEAKSVVISLLAKYEINPAELALVVKG